MVSQQLTKFLKTRKLCDSDYLRRGQTGGITIILISISIFGCISIWAVANSTLVISIPICWATKRPPVTTTASYIHCHFSRIHWKRNETQHYNENPSIFKKQQIGNYSNEKVKREEEKSRNACRSSGLGNSEDEQIGRNFWNWNRTADTTKKNTWNERKIWRNKETKSIHLILILILILTM